MTAAEVDALNDEPEIEATPPNHHSFARQDTELSTGGLSRQETLGDPAGMSRQETEQFWPTWQGRLGGSAPALPAAPGSLMTAAAASFASPYHPAPSSTMPAMVNYVDFASQEGRAEAEDFADEPETPAQGESEDVSPTEGGSQKRHRKHRRKIKSLIDLAAKGKLAPPLHPAPQQQFAENAAEQETGTGPDQNKQLIFGSDGHTSNVRVLPKHSIGGGYGEAANVSASAFASQSSNVSASRFASQTSNVSASKFTSQTSNVSASKFLSQSSAASGEPTDETRAKFCPFCGGKCQPHFKFCRFCGASLWD